MAQYKLCFWQVENVLFQGTKPESLNQLAEWKKKKINKKIRIIFKGKK